MLILTGVANVFSWLLSLVALIFSPFVAIFGL